MKEIRFLMAAMAAMAASLACAAASAADDRVIYSDVQKDYEDYIVKDAPLAQAIRDKDVACRIPGLEGKISLKAGEVLHEANMLAAGVPSPTPEEVAQAVREWRAKIAAAQKQCEVKGQAASALLAAIIGATAGGREIKTFAFEDKVFVKLGKPAPPAHREPMGDAEIVHPGLGAQ